MDRHKKKHKKLLRNMRVRCECLHGGLTRHVLTACAGSQDPSVSSRPRRSGSVMQQSGRRSVASGRRSAEPSSTAHRHFEYIP